MSATTPLLTNMGQSKSVQSANNLRSMIILGVRNNYPDTTPTQEQVVETAQAIAAAINFTGELQGIIAEVMAAIDTSMGAGVSLVDAEDDHDDKWVEKRQDMAWTYSNAYEDFLRENSWQPTMVQSLSDVTARILGLLEDPAREADAWNRRGLVIGHVQSGKTANYTGLAARAADAGYKVIIVIAGIHNNLRRQTQERIDAALIGRSSNPEDKWRPIGVGLRRGYPHPATLTTVNEDFNKKTAEKSNWKLNDLSKPIILVIKKNTKTLEQLYKWLDNLNTEKNQESRVILGAPMLLVDDEADNASINTNREDINPTKTNSWIRKILRLFAKSCYVGYTATPFANIFINHEDYDNEAKEELFPRDFIYCLDAPNTYFSAQKVFINEDKSSKVVRSIRDCDAFIPHDHGSEYVVQELPPSLYQAFNEFIIARAVRNLRGQQHKHCSMMVNVSRFVSVQKRVRDLLRLREVRIQESVRANYRMPDEASHRDPYMRDLRAAFDREYEDAGFTWEEVRGALNSVFDHLKLYVINSKSDEALDYGRYERDGIGLTAVAIGGLSLSRGLTIEGLTTSYMYRNTKMYDTLMQMGRWFGYRSGYEDLCRVHLSLDSINWYAHIAEAADELVMQVAQMRRDGRSPTEFGLYVRSHPDSLLITARNKMRHGEQFTVSQSYSGRLRESYIVSIDPEVNAANLRLVSDFWRSGFGGAKSEDTRKGLIFRDVRIDVMDRFIAAFKCHKSMADWKGSLLKFLSVIADDHPVGDVLLISPDYDGRNDSPFELTPQKRAVGEDQPNGTAWRLNKDRVASRGDESLGLSHQQMEKAEEIANEARDKKGRGSGKPSDTHYRAVRNKPLLMIHHLEPKNDEFTGPIMAFGISFPFGDYAKTIEVVANRVWFDQMMGHDDDPDYEDDYDA